MPPDVMAQLPGKRPAVAVTINGHTYRTSVGTMGGTSLIPVSADVRRAAGARSRVGAKR